MNIGDKVKVKKLSEFAFGACPKNYGGQRGHIVDFDDSDNSVYIQFTEFDKAWFKPDEINLITFDSIEHALNYLISEGYVVTLTKKDSYE